ncbi:PREDICTED: protein LLP homolog [Nicrophorus vespilloides]|uniref:Protein LLP homolog n=1 Tax=Nicrophorus vespilloides TaxID=110193 RepID=A0ABM1M5X0_NICVS|nr:PREDICTED: protein LLP homolog [Nicrophorus vespilloides]
MAKSLRSKWKRKGRALKRVRYGEKELARLKKTLGIDENNKEPNMDQVSEIATVVDGKTVSEPKADGDQMDTTREIKEIYDPKTYKDKNGQYPVWMTNKQIKQLKTQTQKKKKIQKKKLLNRKK